MRRRNMPRTRRCANGNQRWPRPSLVDVAAYALGVLATGAVLAPVARMVEKQ